MENLVSLLHLTSFYEGKKVFVTGHTGFKGAWLIACLYLMKARIRGYSLAPEYKNGLFDILKPLQTCESVIDDIRNKNKLADDIISFQPDYIFHLCAKGLACPLFLPWALAGYLFLHLFWSRDRQQI